MTKLKIKTFRKKESQIKDTTVMWLKSLKPNAVDLLVEKIKKNLLECQFVEKLPVMTTIKIRWEASVAVILHLARLFIASKRLRRSAADVGLKRLQRISHGLKSLAAKKKSWIAHYRKVTKNCLKDRLPTPRAPPQDVPMIAIIHTGDVPKTPSVPQGISAVRNGIASPNVAALGVSAHHVGVHSSFGNLEQMETSVFAVGVAVPDVSAVNIPVPIAADLGSVQELQGIVGATPTVHTAHSSAFGTGIQGASTPLERPVVLPQEDTPHREVEHALPQLPLFAQQQADGFTGITKTSTPLSTPRVLQIDENLLVPRPMVSFRNSDGRWIDASGMVTSTPLPDLRLLQRDEHELVQPPLALRRDSDDIALLPVSLADRPRTAPRNRGLIVDERTKIPHYTQRAIRLNEKVKETGPRRVQPNGTLPLRAIWETYKRDFFTMPGRAVNRITDVFGDDHFFAPTKPFHPIGRGLRNIFERHAMTNEVPDPVRQRASAPRSVREELVQQRPSRRSGPAATSSTAASVLATIPEGGVVQDAESAAMPIDVQGEVQPIADNVVVPVDGLQRIPEEAHVEHETVPAVIVENVADAAPPTRSVVAGDDVVTGPMATPMDALDIPTLDQQARVGAIDMRIATTPVTIRATTPFDGVAVLPGRAVTPMAELDIPIFDQPAPVGSIEMAAPITPVPIRPTTHFAAVSPGRTVTPTATSGVVDHLALLIDAMDIGVGTAPVVDSAVAPADGTVTQTTGRLSVVRADPSCDHLPILDAGGLTVPKADKRAVSIGMLDSDAAPLDGSALPQLPALESGGVALSITDEPTITTLPVPPFGAIAGEGVSAPAVDHGAAPGNFVGVQAAEEPRPAIRSHRRSAAETSVGQASPSREVPLSPAEQIRIQKRQMLKEWQMSRKMVELQPGLREHWKDKTFVLAKLKELWTKKTPAKLEEILGEETCSQNYLRLVATLAKLNGELRVNLIDENNGLLVAPYAVLPFEQSFNGR